MNEFSKLKTVLKEGNVFPRRICKYMQYENEKWRNIYNVHKKKAQSKNRQSEMKVL